jgi:hypothetical protein
MIGGSEQWWIQNLIFRGDHIVRNAVKILEICFFIRRINTCRILFIVFALFLNIFKLVYRLDQKSSPYSNPLIHTGCIITLEI